MDYQKIWFELHIKYSEKVHGSQLGNHNCLPILLFVSDLPKSLLLTEMEGTLVFGVLMERWFINLMLAN